MEKCTIELTAEDLLVIARMTGILLGDAVPDRYCDRELILSVFNRANEKISDLLAANCRIISRRCQRIELVDRS